MSHYEQTHPSQAPHLDQEASLGQVQACPDARAAQGALSAQFSNGRWTKSECELFCKYYATYGKDWKRIAMHIPTRNAEQVRSHAQKFLFRKERKENEQLEIQQAKRLIQETTGKRTTRAAKIFTSPAKANCARQPQSQMCEEEKIEVSQAPSRAQRPKERKEKLKKQVQDSKPNRGIGMKQPDEDKKQASQKSIPVTAHCIEMPEPDLSLCQGFYYGHSLLYQTLLPFIIRGAPIPAFITADNYQPSFNMQLGPGSATLQSPKYCGNLSYNPGFVALSGNPISRDSIFGVRGSSCVDLGEREARSRSKSVGKPRKTAPRDPKLDYLNYDAGL